MTSKNSAGGWFANIAAREKEAAGLRSIARASGLDERLKWGMPCYTLNGKNIVGVGLNARY